MSIFKHKPNNCFICNNRMDVRDDVTFIIHSRYNGLHCTIRPSPTHSVDQEELNFSSAGSYSVPNKNKVLIFHRQCFENIAGDYWTHGFEK